MNRINYLELYWAHRKCYVPSTSHHLQSRKVVQEVLTEDYFLGSSGLNVGTLRIWEGNKGVIGNLNYSLTKICCSEL